ncbi:MAG: cysteine synthase family protein [Bacteroidetes bacterium]|jgi:cysteine synthase A|nr:cysteine synthase family protein [Bacteroidota bacterium]
MRPSDTVGNTPLLKISDKLYAKFETYNPSGSIKDRIATYIINAAEKNNLIKKGDTIVEATSGNTGIAFSFIGAERGYNVKIIMPRNMSEERKQMMRLFGAEIIEVADGDFDGAIALRNELAEKNGWFNTNQFHNALNIECHEKTTGIEVLSQTKNIGEISAIVLGTGTGGTIMGLRKALINVYPQMKVVACEPAESPVMSGGEHGLHGIQGIGDGSKFLVDLNVLDDIVLIKTEEAKERARRLVKENGIFVGFSSGANVLAAERWIEKNNPEGIVVTVLSDRAERYLSIF